MQVCSNVSFRFHILVIIANPKHNPESFLIESMKAEFVCSIYTFEDGIH